MEQMKCPGQDTRFWKPDDIFVAECPKCGHRTAYFWLVQTRAGDEPETKFLRCEKCGHTWRDYN